MVVHGPKCSVNIAALEVTLEAVMKQLHTVMCMRLKSMKTTAVAAAVVGPRTIYERPCSHCALISLLKEVKVKITAKSVIG